MGKPIYSDSHNAETIRKAKKRAWLKYLKCHDHSTENGNKWYTPAERNFMLYSKLPQREIARILGRSVAAIQTSLVKFRDQELIIVESFPKLTDEEFMKKWRALHPYNKESKRHKDRYKKLKARGLVGPGLQNGKPRTEAQKLQKKEYDRNRYLFGILRKSKTEATR